MLLVSDSVMAFSFARAKIDLYRFSPAEIRLSTFAETDINPSWRGIVPQGHLRCNGIFYDVRSGLSAVSCRQATGWPWNLVERSPLIRVSSHAISNSHAPRQHARQRRAHARRVGSRSRLRSLSGCRRERLISVKRKELSVIEVVFHWNMVGVALGSIRRRARRSRLWCIRTGRRIAPICELFDF